MGYVLGRGAGAAAVAWWLSGGVSAANAIAAYQPIGAASLAASYTNLANPGTLDATVGVAPTFDTATGWAFNGSTQYLDSGVTPASGWTIAIRFSDASNTGWIIRSADSGGASGIGIAPRRYSSGSGWYAQHGNATIGQGIAAITPALSNGVAIVAGSDGYLNGSDVADMQATFTGPVTAIIIGAAQSYGGTVAGFCAAKIQAIAIYNTTLTAPQVAAISAAMAAL